MRRCTAQANALEVGAKAAGELLLGVVEEEEAKVEHRARHGLAVDRDVRLVEVPSAGAALERAPRTFRTGDESKTEREWGGTHRTMSVAILSLSLYFLPSGDSNEMVRLTASYRLTCPSRLLAQVGEFESSKSAMNVAAPEFNALFVREGEPSVCVPRETSCVRRGARAWTHPMTIFLETGPVISTRLSSRPGLGAGPCQVGSLRMCSVSLRKSGSAPASNWACWSWRRWRSDLRVGLKLRWRTARNSSAAGVRISWWRPARPSCQLTAQEKEPETGGVRGIAGSGESGVKAETKLLTFDLACGQHANDTQSVHTQTCRAHRWRERRSGRTGPRAGGGR